jgi:hypothetical protein
MTIKEQILADNAIFLDTDAFAEQITYNGTPITAVVALGDSSLRGDTFERKGRSAVGMIQVSVLDVPKPNTGDVIVHQSVTWKVARILESDFALHVLQIITEESPWP